MGGIASNNNIYYRAGRHGRWKQIAGKLKEIAVSGNGRFICGVNQANYIYYRVGVYRSRWRRVPGRLMHITVSGNGWHIWGINHAIDAILYDLDTLYLIDPIRSP